MDKPNFVQFNMTPDLGTKNFHGPCKPQQPALKKYQQNHWIIYNQTYKSTAESNWIFNIATLTLSHMG